MEITLHRALAMRKTTKERVRKEIGACTFIEVAIGTADTVNGVSVEQIRKNIKAGYDKITALIDNYEALNRAISRTNAGVTSESNIAETEIGGKKYVLADLIKLVDVVRTKKLLIEKMNLGYISCRLAVLSAFISGRLRM